MRAACRTRTVLVPGAATPGGASAGRGEEPVGEPDAAGGIGQRRGVGRECDEDGGVGGEEGLDRAEGLGMTLFGLDAVFIDPDSGQLLQADAVFFKP